MIYSFHKIQSKRIYKIYSYTHIPHENQQLSRVGTQFRLDIVTLMHQTSLGRHLHPRSHRLLTPRAPRVSEKYICDWFSFSLRSIFSSLSRRDETSAKTRVRKKIAGCTYGYYREHRRENCQTRLLEIIRIKPSCSRSKERREGVKFKEDLQKKF